MTISLPSTLVKTAVVHTITYFIAGVLAYTTMNYEKAFADPALHGYMRATTERIVMAGPLFQPIRGCCSAWFSTLSATRRSGGRADG